MSASNHQVGQIEKNRDCIIPACSLVTPELSCLFDLDLALAARSAAYDLKTSLLAIGAIIIDDRST